MVAGAPMVDCECIDTGTTEPWTLPQPPPPSKAQDIAGFTDTVAETPGAFQPYSSGAPQCAPDNGNRLVTKMTCDLKTTFQTCNPSLKIVDSAQGPSRKILTSPGIGTKNDGFDNDKSDLIIAVNDVLMNSSTEKEYIVKGMLGQGTFGQVVCCWSEDRKTEVAVKIIKNQPAYFNQARVEIGILQLLNTRCDPDDKRHVVRLYDYFVYKQHLCLVFEKLDINLYELLKHNKHHGLSLDMVRRFLHQVLDAMSLLRDANIIHCDLKPENILLQGPQTLEVKLIDYGSACFENRSVYSYIQSRFYRSPEVILGLEYNAAIDAWSLGCVAAELFLGIPLFPGLSEHDLLVRIVEMLGQPGDWFLQKAKNTERFFSSGVDSHGRIQYTIRSQADFEEFNSVKAVVGKRYFKHNTLHDLICLYPLKCGLSDEEQMKEKQQREAFLDFLLGVLDLDPVSRWSPRQAASHPFITGEKFTGPFQPQPDPKQPIMALETASASVCLPFHSPGSVTPPATPSLSSPPWVMGTPGSLPSAQCIGFSPAQAQAHAIAMAALQHLSPKFGSLSAHFAAENAWQSMATGLFASSLPSSLPGVLPTLSHLQPQAHAWEQPLSLPAPGTNAPPPPGPDGARTVTAAVPISIPATPTSLPYLVASVGHPMPFGGVSQLSVGATPSTSYMPSLDGSGLFSAYSGIPASPGTFGSFPSSLPHSFVNHFGMSPAAWGDMHQMAAAAAVAAVAAQQQQQQSLFAQMASTPSASHTHLPLQPQMYATTPNKVTGMELPSPGRVEAFQPGVSFEHNRWQSVSVPHASHCSGLAVHDAPAAPTSYTAGLSFPSAAARGYETYTGQFDAMVDQTMHDQGGMNTSPAETSDVESMSLNPSPGDWDPLYSDDQLLDEGSEVQQLPYQTSTMDGFDPSGVLSPNRGAHQMPRSFAVCSTLSSSEAGSVGGSVATVGSVVSPNAPFGIGFMGFPGIGDVSGALAPSPSMPVLKPGTSASNHSSGLMGFNMSAGFGSSLTHMGAVGLTNTVGHNQLSLRIDTKLPSNNEMQQP